MFYINILFAFPPAWFPCRRSRRVSCSAPWEPCSRSAWTSSPPSPVSHRCPSFCGILRSSRRCYITLILMRSLRFAFRSLSSTPAASALAPSSWANITRFGVEPAGGGARGAGRGPFCSGRGRWWARSCRSWLRRLLLGLLRIRSRPGCRCLRICRCRWGRARLGRWRLRRLGCWTCCLISLKTSEKQYFTSTPKIYH